MREVITRILELKELYPKEIKLYSPAEKEDIKSVENILSIQLDEQLLALYNFSNGISFLDYCLVGFGNKELASLLDINDFSLNPAQCRRDVVVFMSCMGGEDYGYVHEPNQAFHKVVWKREDIYGSSEGYQVIAETVEDFFMKFLNKISIVLEAYIANRSIMYRTDKSLPADFLIWK